MEEKNRLYDQFDTKKIEDFTADNLDSFRDQIFIEESNEKIMNDLIRLGTIANQLSFSGPISRSIQVIQTTLTQKDVAGREIIYTPGAGEVWRAIAFSATWSLNANPTFLVQVGSGSGVNDYVTCIECTVNATAQTTQPEPLLNEITNTGSREGGYNPDIHFDKDNPLSVWYGGGTSITANPVVTSLILRVR